MASFGVFSEIVLYTKTHTFSNTFLGGCLTGVSTSALTATTFLFLFSSSSLVDEELLLSEALPRFLPATLKQLINVSKLKV